MRVEETILDRMKLFLDFSAKKQQVLTSNLANAETPGYKAKELSFADLFSTAREAEGSLKTTRSKHLAAEPVLLREPRIEERPNDALGHDGNNIDLDQEMTQLAQNVLKFSVVSQLYQNKIRLIRYSLQEGRNG